MDVKFKNSKVEKLCTIHSHAGKTMNPSEVKKLYNFLATFRIVNHLGDIQKFPGDLHPYKHGSPIFTLDLSHQKRLYFVACNEEAVVLDDGVTIDKTSITEVEIIGIGNHKTPPH